MVSDDNRPNLTKINYIYKILLMPFPTQKSNQKGLTPIAVIIIITAIVAGAILVFRRTTSETSTQVNQTESTISAELKSPSPSAFSSTTKSPTPTAKSKTTSSPTPKPTSQPKTITLSGFAYEDTNNDGLFNSVDPKIPYMQFFVYDSATNEQITTVYTEANGEFSFTTTVKGNLPFKPTCSNNFCPREEGTKTFSSSTSNLQYGFRSGSAPKEGSNGIIEGDIIVENEKLYKFYLMDKDNNYYQSGGIDGGHFKFDNLPDNRTYVIRISYADGNQQDMEVTLTPSSKEKRNIQVRIK